MWQEKPGEYGEKGEKDEGEGEKGKKEEGGKVKWTSKGQGGWAVLGWCHDSPLRSRQKACKVKCGLD